MRIRWLFSLAIFCGSYLPFGVILAVQDADFGMMKNGVCPIWKEHSDKCGLPLHHPALALAIVAVCSVCLVLELFTLRAARPNLPITVKDSKYIPAELMSYILPYVVAFMGIGYQETAKFAGLLIFLGWMFLITHKAGQIMLNPVLAVFGWRLYEIKFQFLGDDVIRSGRALATLEIETGCCYGHATVQDIMILGSKPAHDRT